MAADLRWLRGKIEENPLTAEVDLDRLLVGLFQSLVNEQKLTEAESNAPASEKELHS